MKTNPTGPELKKRREAAGVPASAVAKVVGLTPVALWLFEAGKTAKPRNLDAILAAYEKLDSLPKKTRGGGEAPEKKKRGKTGRPPKIKPKRRYIRKPTPEPVNEGDPDDGLDGCMKNSTYRDRGKKKAAVPQAAASASGVVDKNYLLAQLESWKKNGVNTVTIGIPGQPEHPPRTFIIATESQICEYGRLVALRCGKNPE